MLLLSRRAAAAAGFVGLLGRPPQEQANPASSAAIRSQVSIKVNQDPTLAGPLLRLAFHDATTGKPNGSIQYELERAENRALSKPLSVVKEIHAQQQQRSTNTISLADVIALAGSEAVHATGGPSIPIRLGRIDAKKPDSEYYGKPTRQSPKNPFSQTNLLRKRMPSPGLNSEGLRIYFRRLGLSEEEFVALSGSHGMGRHVSLLNMPKNCLRHLTRTCLEEAPVSLPFVTSSVDHFDNTYFQYLLKWNERNVTSGQVAFIPTDVALVVDSRLSSHVKRFSEDQLLYFEVFTRSYQKLTEMGLPLTNKRQ